MSLKPRFLFFPSKLLVIYAPLLLFIIMVRFSLFCTVHYAMVSLNATIIYQWGVQRLVIRLATKLISKLLILFEWRRTLFEIAHLSTRKLHELNYVQIKSFRSWVNIKRNQYTMSSKVLLAKLSKPGHCTWSLRPRDVPKHLRPAPNQTRHINRPTCPGHK